MTGARIDRRAGERIAISVPARIHTGTHEQSGRTIDISREGACVRCDANLLTVGERITFTVGELVAKGSATWKGMDRVGIRFDAEIAPASIEAVVGMHQ